jgi:hypothetical protein
MTDPLPILLALVFVVSYPWWITSGYANAIRRVMRCRWLVPVADTLKGLGFRRAANRLYRRAQRREKVGKAKHALVWLVAPLGRCKLCRQHFWPAISQTDHWYTPWSDGGSNSLVNLRNLCGPRRYGGNGCNQWKATKTPEQIGAR